MINKVLNNKIIWIVLISIIVVLFIVVFSLNMNKNRNHKIIDNNSNSDFSNNTSNNEEDLEVKKTRNIIFELNGNEEVLIYQGDKYEELGFIAKDNEENLTDFVTINNNINTNIVGNYKVEYILKYDDLEKILIRKVSVNEIPSEEIKIELKGEEKVYLDNNSNYLDEGASAYFKDRDLSSEIKVIKEEVNENKYYLKYSIREKEIKREVIKLNIDKMISIDNNKLEVTINLDDNISSVKLPNGNSETSKNIVYKIDKSGVYNFKFYTNNNKEFVKNIEIKSTDIKAPSGSCVAILKDGKTTITVTTSDNIQKYYYNGVDSSGKVYNIDKYLRSSKVRLVGINNKESEITCSTKMEYMPVYGVKNGKKVLYQANTDTLKVKIVKDSGIALAYVWVKDANRQLYKDYGDATPDKILEAAVKNRNLKSKIAVGFNISPPVNSKYYDKWNKDSKYKHKEPSPLMIQNGKVLVNDPNKNLNLFMYYIDDSNKIRYIPNINTLTVAKRKEYYKQIIDSGARNTIVWRPILVENSKATTLGKDFLNGQNPKAQWKQALCQIDGNNFIVASSIHNDSGLITYPNFQKFLVNLGCRTAVEFDAGGSSALLWKPGNTTSVKKIAGSNRSLTSVMYFTE